MSESHQLIIGHFRDRQVFSFSHLHCLCQPHQNNQETINMGKKHKIT